MPLKGLIESSKPKAAAQLLLMADDGGGSSSSSESSEAERCRAEERGHETFMHLGILVLLLLLDLLSLL